jgi:hypothetical protein
MQKLIVLTTVVIFTSFALVWDSRYKIERNPFGIDSNEIQCIRSITTTHQIKYRGNVDNDGYTRMVF